MMKQGNRKNWFMLVALVLVMVVAGDVGRIKAASAAVKPTKLRMMMSIEPAMPGPMGSMHGVSTPAEPITYNVMESLVGYTRGGPVPKLATKWEHSPDYTKWRFYLRKGVKFHDGSDFNAAAVVECAKWYIELKSLCDVYQYMPIQKAVVVDDYTIDIIFADSQPLFLVNARLFLIAPPSQTRDNRAMYPIHPMGTGPYKFVEWKRGQYIKLAKFDGYWGPKPQIDEVEIIFRGEESVRLAALRAGEVDWVYGLKPESASQAPKIVRMASPETAWLRFDEYVQKEFTGKDPIFADKRLRLAIEYAINRESLVKLYNGYCTPSLGQFASPGEFGFNPSLKNRPYDLEKAKALVREAGAVGKTVTFVCATDRWSKGPEVGESIAYMIEQTGLKVKLMLMTHAEHVKYLRVVGDERKYMDDLHISTSDSPVEVESRFPKNFVEGGTQCAINDPETTRLYKEVLAETNFTKRGERVAKAWAYIYEQAHYVPLFKIEWIWGLAKNLEWNVGIVGVPFVADMRFTD